MWGSIESLSSPPFQLPLARASTSLGNTEVLQYVPAAFPAALHVWGRAGPDERHELRTFATREARGSMPCGEEIGRRRPLLVRPGRFARTD